MAYHHFISKVHLLSQYHVAALLAKIYDLEGHPKLWCMGSPKTWIVK